MSILSTKTDNDMALRAPLVLLIAITLSCSAQAQDARVVTRIVKDTIPAWMTWKDDAGSMNYPGDWNLAETSGDTLASFRRSATGQADAWAEVSLIKGTSGKNISPAGKNGIRIIASTDPDASGAYSVEYTGTTDAGAWHALKQVQVHGKQAYTLTYMASEKSYGEYLFKAQAMMNSFSPTAE